MILYEDYFIVVNDLSLSPVVQNPSLMAVLYLDKEKDWLRLADLGVLEMRKAF